MGLQNTGGVVDLNTAIANLERTFTLRAERDRQQAAEILKQLDTPYGAVPDAARVIKADAQRFTERAALWDRYAADAKAGFLRHEMGSTFAVESIDGWDSVWNAAVRADRVRYVKPMAGYDAHGALTGGLEADRS